MLRRLLAPLLIAACALPLGASAQFAARPQAAPVVQTPAVKSQQVDEDTVRRLNELAERLEKAVARAEAKADPQAVESKPTGAPAVEEDFGMPYEETVVAASRRAQATIEAPNAITVITGDEIRAAGLLTLPEILRRVPGAEVMVMGVTSANDSFRGFNQRVANKVLVLVDGRPEYQDFIGVSLWSALPVGLEEIERVEVIRGPGSALYGANAMLGVVNIITRAPGTGPALEASGFAGNGNLAGASLVASGGGRVRYRASAGYQQANKYTRDFGDDRPDVASRIDDPNLAYRSVRANLTGFLAINQDFSVALSGGINRLFTELYALGLLRNFSLDGLAGSLRSSVNQNVAPLPSSESTPIVPPCSSTSWRVIDSPSPVPPYFRPVPPSTCSKVPKMRSWWAASTPIPVSLILTVTWPCDTWPDTSEDTSTAPFSVNLMALPTRL